MKQRVSFLPKTEQGVEEGHEGPSLKEARAGGTQRDPMPAEAMRFDPEYAAKNRAQALMSMQVINEHSPSTRYSFDSQLHDREGNLTRPFAYRWMCTKRRERTPGGLKGWEPVTDMEEAKRLTGHADLRVDADGKIVNAGLFLARIPSKTAENRIALNYQRSQRLINDSKNGRMNPLVKTAPGQAAPAAGPTLADMHDQAASAGDPGVTTKGTLTIQDGPLK